MKRVTVHLIFGTVALCCAAVAAYDWAVASAMSAYVLATQREHSIFLDM